MKLRWGHIIEGLSGAADGTISLEGVIEYITLPPSIDGWICPHLRVALSFGAEPGDAADHEIVVILAKADEKKIGPAWSGTVHLATPHPAFPPSAVRVIEMRELLFPGVGNYQFFVWAGKLLGTVPFHVVHPPAEAAA